LSVQDLSLLDRRVLAVKIDNHPRAQPQSGIEQADAVIEVPVEGITRFIALFHNSDAKYLGPVRSARPTDGTLLNSLDATLVISGGQDWVISSIRQEEVPLVGEEAPSLFRIRSRRAPHNLYADTLLIRQLADQRGYPDHRPQPMWQFGHIPASAEEAGRISIDFGSGDVVTWTWAESRYLRSNGSSPSQYVTKAGVEGNIGADTLIVIFANRYMADAPSGATSVPAMDTTGYGKALVFGEGKVLAGTWIRKASDQAFSLVDSQGDTIPVPTGKPWISIVPTGNDVDF
jgi:hypothetical protein